MSKNYVEMDETEVMETVEDTEIMDPETDEEIKPGFKDKVKGLVAKAKESKIAKIAIVGGAVVVGAAGALALAGRRSSDEDSDDVVYDIDSVEVLDSLVETVTTE